MHEPVFLLCYSIRRCHRSCRHLSRSSRPVNIHRPTYKPVPSRRSRKQMAVTRWIHKHISVPVEERSVVPPECKSLAIFVLVERLNDMTTSNNLARIVGRRCSVIHEFDHFQTSNILGNTRFHLPVAFEYDGDGLTGHLDCTVPGLPVERSVRAIGPAFCVPSFTPNYFGKFTE